MNDLIFETIAFLKNTFKNSNYLEQHPYERDYRLEHSFRVANIAKTIAEKESLNINNAVVAGLLHDIAYCEEMKNREDQMNHGRKSAEIARPFLVKLGLGENDINDICYAIAIHVDDNADFEWERTVFSETVGDADNIDRFDAYRIYETLQYNNFSEMKLEEKLEYVLSMTDKLRSLTDMKLGTETAGMLWISRLDFYIDFYTKLFLQLSNSSKIEF